MVARGKELGADVAAPWRSGLLELREAHAVVQARQQQAQKQQEPTQEAAPAPSPEEPPEEQKQKPTPSEPEGQLRVGISVIGEVAEEEAREELHRGATTPAVPQLPEEATL